SETLTTDVRIVGATNEDLPRLARQGRFRPDLMDRLAFDVIHVPPLRARPEDIGPLASPFPVHVTRELKRSVFPGSSPHAPPALRAYDWPGNVRELKNAVERSVYRAPDPEAPIEEILFDPFASPFESPPQPASPEAAEEDQADEDESPRLPPGRMPTDLRSAV